MRRFLPLILGSQASKSHVQQRNKLTIYLSIYLSIPEEPDCNLFLSNVYCARIIKRNYRQLIFLPTTHERFKYIQTIRQPIVYEQHALLMVVISQNKPEIIQTRTQALRVRTISLLTDKNWKNEIVHLSTIHSITFESPTNLSPIGKQ